MSELTTSSISRIIPLSVLTGRAAETARLPPASTLARPEASFTSPGSPAFAGMISRLSTTLGEHSLRFENRLRGVNLDDHIHIHVAGYLSS